MNILTTAITIIIILLFLLLILIFLPRSESERDEIDIYKVEMELKECQNSLDKKIKQYERYKILTNT